MAHLTLVPTPIGNLADITLRALDTLKAADVIAAEDTRHSRKLLNHYTIDKPLVRLDAHTVNERAEAVLAAHERVAFITDAGTPGISDPGAELLRLALTRGDTVEVLPGATAFVPALVLSGLATSRFTFEGFLPRKGKVRRERLAAIAERRTTSILYESPHRTAATLKDLVAVCGEARLASVSRELTKRFETVYRGTLADLSAQLAGPVKGEIVIVVAPNDAPNASDTVDAEALLIQLKQLGLSGRALKDALIERGVPRNKAYALILD